jgi:hypothetical protein
MESANGKVEVKATKARRQEALRVQTFYLRGQLDAAEQLLRNAQKIAYTMFGGEAVGVTQTGDLPFMVPPKKRRRPRSPEAIARAVATRRKNQEAHADELRRLQRLVEQQGKKGEGKPSKLKAGQPTSEQVGASAAA